MVVTEKELEQTFNNYSFKYGGQKEDYFAALYLSKEFDCQIEDIIHQVAFGGNDYGIDAFHIDKERRNLYLFQFKWSKNHSLFKESFNRLISAGMDRIFGNPLQDQMQNQLIIQLKSALNENKALIDQVLIHFVFIGDPKTAEQSAVLDSLREDLESKKYLIDQFFLPREVDLIFQYKSSQTKMLTAFSHTKKTHKFDIDFNQSITTSSPTDETLHVGFIKLMDLYGMYREMGPRFFERNIRAGLSADKPPNRAIRRALKSIVLQQQYSPEVFIFNHNGVTLAAERFTINNDKVNIIEPRLLNGAQTITSLNKFIKENEDNPALKKNDNLLQSIRVLAKIISVSSDDFIVNVTVCNNQQNPVEPWNLRANDKIQLEFQDKFKQDLGIYYERQEGAFKNLSYEDLEESGFDSEHGKSIEIKPLAQTLLAVQGEIARMSRLRNVFENERLYKDAFKESFLHSDAKKILLAYKIHKRLNKITDVIKEKGEVKYHYIKRARNLVWALQIQGLLNDPKLPNLCERFGEGLVIEADFNQYLKNMASKKVRFIISGSLQDERYQKSMRDEKYDFLRTKEMFKRCMAEAYERYNWKKQSF